MEKIRIGVVGTGHLGRFHLQKYQKMPGCLIVGVADVVEEYARKAAEGCEQSPVLGARDVEDGEKRANAIEDARWKCELCHV